MEAYGYGKLYPVTVVKVIDGDTIKVNYNGVVEKVRFLEVNTLEVFDSSSMDKDIKRFNLPKRQLKSLGMMGSHLTKALIHKGDTVWLSFDGEKRGYYGRLLAFIHLSNGAVMNELLIRDGVAMVYRSKYSSTSHHREYLYKEMAARGSNLGIWGTRSIRDNFLK